MMRTIHIVRLELQVDDEAELGRIVAYDTQGNSYAFSVVDKNGDQLSLDITQLDDVETGAVRPN